MDDSGKISFIVLIVLIGANIILQLSCDLYVIKQVHKFDKQYSIAKEYESNYYDKSISINEAISKLKMVEKNALSFLYKTVITGSIGILLSFCQLFSKKIYDLIISESYKSYKHSVYIDYIKAVGYLVSVVTFLAMGLEVINVIKSYNEIYGILRELTKIIAKVNI